jgi:hypothetical protein
MALALLCWVHHNAIDQQVIGMLLQHSNTHSATTALKQPDLLTSDAWAVILLGGFRDVAEHRQIGGNVRIRTDLPYDRQIRRAGVSDAIGL